MKQDPIETALARLDEIPVHTPEGKASFAKALAGKSNLVVAKAARLLGNAQWTDLNTEMAAAFDRMMAKGATTDKGCAAMIAIARALVQMEYDDPDLFLRGIRHIQMEGSYGPPIDTAVELREVCAMGLANTGYPYRLRELVSLLIDKEWRVRGGAVRAIAVVGNDAAALLLRLKILTGDKDPDVMADCFASMLAVEGAEGLPLVTPFVKSANPEVREAAILALGASRRPDAIDWLMAEFEKTADPPGRKCIFLALSTSRTESAIDFLIDQIRRGGSSTSTMAVEVLAIHSRDESLRERVEDAIRFHGSGE